jgi:rod shape determining protein RodA
MRLPRFRLVNVDWLFLVAALGVVAIGATYLASASPSAFLAQVRWIGVGALMLGFTLAVGYERFLRHAYALYAAVMGLLVVVLFTPAIRGAHSWIVLPGVRLQPSELAKIAVVLALARHLMNRETQTTLRGLLAPVALTLAPMALILKQPDLGTAMTLVPVLFVVLFASGARPAHLLGSLAAGAAAAVPMWLFLMKEYQKRRIYAFLAPERYEAREAYQLVMARIGIGSGGWAGAGWGQGDINSLGLLPDRHTDFLFVVVAEEGGLLRAGLLILLYAVLVLCGLGAAMVTREPGGRLVAVGATTVIGAQALINLGVVETLLPTTGITLPLVSYGGSSMVATCILLGLVLSVGASRPTVLHGETFRGTRA